jgi:hypothetical protein
MTSYNRQYLNYNPKTRQTQTQVCRKENGGCESASNKYGDWTGQDMDACSLRLDTGHHSTVY